MEAPGICVDRRGQGPLAPSKIFECTSAPISNLRRCKRLQVPKQLKQPKSSCLFLACHGELSQRILCQRIGLFQAVNCNNCADISKHFPIPAKVELARKVINRIQCMAIQPGNLSAGIGLIIVLVKEMDGSHTQVNSRSLGAF